MTPASQFMLAVFREWLIPVTSQVMKLPLQNVVSMEYLVISHLVKTTGNIIIYPFSVSSASQVIIDAIKMDVNFPYHVIRTKCIWFKSHKGNKQFAIILNTFGLYSQSCIYEDS